MTEGRGDFIEGESPQEHQPRVTATQMDCCLLQLYEQGRWSDSVIKVKSRSSGYHSLGVHKLILAVRSPVFEGIFYGPLAQTDDVVLEQFDHNTMDLFLRCVYGGLKTLNDPQKSNLPDETSIHTLLEIAHYFQVADIVSWCEEALAETLTISNACELLDMAFMYGFEKLRDAAIDFIDAEAKYIVKTDSFFDMSEDSLKYILSGDTFYLSREKIHGAVEGWLTKRKKEFEMTGKDNLDVSRCECSGSISKDMYDVLSHTRVKPYEKLTLPINTEPTKTMGESCVYNVATARDVTLDSIQFSDFHLLLDWGCYVAPFLSDGLPVRVTVSCKKIKYLFMEQMRVGELKDLKILPMALPSCSDEYEIRVSLEFNTADRPIILEVPVYTASVGVCSKGKDVRVSYKSDNCSTIDSPDAYIEQPICWIGPGVSQAFEESITAPPALIKTFTFKIPSVRANLRKTINM